MNRKKEGLERDAVPPDHRPERVLGLACAVQGRWSEAAYCLRAAALGADSGSGRWLQVAACEASKRSPIGSRSWTTAKPPTALRQLIAGVRRGGASTTDEVVQLWLLDARISDEASGARRRFERMAGRLETYAVNPDLSAERRAEVAQLLDAARRRFPQSTPPPGSSKPPPVEDRRPKD